MNLDQITRHLRRANDVARRAASMGRHPFGALLVAPDGETVLAEQGNIDTVNHAEATLARTAADNWPGEYLARCTLVTTFEPCAMCTGTLSGSSWRDECGKVIDDRCLLFTDFCLPSPLDDRRIHCHPV